MGLFLYWTPVKSILANNEDLFGVLPIGCGGSVFVFVLLYIAFFPFWFCNHQRAGCLAFIVLWMSCYSKCSVTLPHGAVGCFVFL